MLGKLMACSVRGGGVISQTCVNQLTQHSELCENDEGGYILGPLYFWR